MKENYNFPSEKASSPEEELKNIREELRLTREALQKKEGLSLNSEKESQDYIQKYKNVPTENVLSENFATPEDEIEQIALDLIPEDHDVRMQELISHMKENGIKNTLSVVHKIGNAHLEDDFHRFVAEYVREGFDLVGVKEKTPVSRMLNMNLFEVVLPPFQKEDGHQLKLAEILSSMEQFYAGMKSVSVGKNIGLNYFALEIAIPNHNEEFIFYASVSRDKSEFFEKHVTAFFPEARVTEIRDDYNIFNEEGVTVGSIAQLTSNQIFPIKTYDKFETDPINGILNSLSKVDKDGEGAAVQIIFNPEGSEDISKKYQKALEKLQKGVPKKEAIDVAFTFGQKIRKGVKDTIKSLVVGKKSKDKDTSLDLSRNQDVIEMVQEKLSSPLYRVNIRLLASSRTEAEANAILLDMESAFNQFQNTQGVKFKFKNFSGSKLKELTREFSFRTFDEKYALSLNIKELTTILHFHTAGVSSTSQLKKAITNQTAAPVSLPKEGILLGVNKVRGQERNVHILEDDRLRHLYIVGQTGTGKSTFMKNMIIQDIQNGEGVCYIDPHGIDIQDVLASVPENRHEDVIYFDPSNMERPMGLNMLEYNPEFPEQKTFVVNELFSIFQKLYGEVPESMGPMFEQYFRNATMLVIDHPESGSTLLDVSRVLADKAYRELKLSKCKNPVVVQFWNKIASQAGGEASLANIVPYITSKFDVFLANEIMRPIIAQQESSFNFREVMDSKKILLVNLAKGRLGDINSNLIGLICVGKILMATLSRVDAYGKEVNPFYLYIDEFQNVTTNSISVILSEARKYKLSLNVAHQFIAQLSPEIKDSVFGNVGSLVAFRVGNEDSEYLEKQFTPIKSTDLMNVENRNAFIKMLVNGQPIAPFSLSVLPPYKPILTDLAKIKEYSGLKYGRKREDVESDIMRKYT